MVISLKGYKPSPRYDGQPWTSARLEGSPNQTGPWAAIQTFPLTPVDTDPTSPVSRNFTSDDALSSQLWVRVVFIDSDADTEITDPIAVNPAPVAFATIRDVASRLGRDFADDELPQVDLLLDAATTIVAHHVGRDSTSIVPVPAILKFVVIELAARALQNPGGTESVREQLGEYSISRSYSEGAGGMWLTQMEGLMVRNAVHGIGIGSSRVASIVTYGS